MFTGLRRAQLNAGKSHGWQVAAMCLFLPACLFDAENRCGEGQTYNEEADVCVCAPDRVATADGCAKCGRNEVVGPAGCECKEGFARAGTECKKAPAGGSGSDDAGASSGSEPEPEATGPEGLGQACTSSDDCAGTDAEYCDTFLTMQCLVQGCELGGSDCPPGYGCQDLSMLGATEPVCAAAICDVTAMDCPEGFTCCQPPIPGFPSVCMQGGCGG